MKRNDLAQGLRLLSKGIGAESEREIMAPLKLVFCVLGFLAMPIWAMAQTGPENMGPAARDWINSVRAAQGRAALAISPQLTKAAAAHAADMARRGYFSHTGADRSGIDDRVRRQGYRFCYVSENIAKGQRSLDEVLRAWVGSKGHRRNLLNAGADEFGLVRGAGNLWVMVLGRDGC